MKSGKELITMASALAIVLSEDTDLEGLIDIVELLGLLKHNLETIKTSRILNKIEDKKDKNAGSKM